MTGALVDDGQRVDRGGEARIGAQRGTCPGVAVVEPAASQRLGGAVVPRS